MTHIFGTFPQVNLARNNDGGPPDDGIIDLTDLNMAVVFSEDHEQEPAQRYSLWYLAAEAATLYQSMNQPNQILIGEAGNVYLLDESAVTDDGAGISVVKETGPLPPASQEFSVTSEKRLHEVWWQIATPPPEGGHQVTLRIVDQDNSAQFALKIVTQVSTKMRVQIGMKAKQWRIRLEGVFTTDFDIVNLGCSFQVVEGPYTNITSA